VEEYYKHASFYEDDESLEDEDAVANATKALEMFPEKNFLLSKKFLTNDAGYISKYGEYFQCNVCSKHRKNEQSKDAHADYCKQSVKYREYLKVLRA